MSVLGRAAGHISSLRPAISNLCLMDKLFLDVAFLEWDKGFLRAKTSKRLQVPKEVACQKEFGVGWSIERRKLEVRLVSHSA
jgi:hypothetical protein